MIPNTASSSVDVHHPPPPQIESRTLDRYRDLLLGGPPTISAREMAHEVGIPLSDVERYWMEMEFPVSDPDRPLFTRNDVDAMKLWLATLHRAGLSRETVAALTRAQSHLTDRLASWELEAMVDNAERAYQLEDSSARVVAIDELKDVATAFESQMVYAWRRQMFALVERMTKDIANRDPNRSKRRFPLRRALGFVDMQSYTATSALLGDQMVDLVERFERLCRRVITEKGGRVVKMIGDAVFFVAEDLEVGLRLVTALIEDFARTSDLLPVRASLIWGDVFSRSGDLFGPPVNLAARLAGAAPPGVVLTDASTAAAIATSSLSKEYSVVDAPSVELRGLGMVRPYVIEHGPARHMALADAQQAA